MIEIAGDDEKEKMKTGVKQTMQTPQGAPLQQKPSVGEQFGQLAMNRAMEGTLNAGETALTGALTGSAPTTSSIATPLMKAGVDGPLANAVAGKAAAGAGTGGAMAALGTAMPYVGMGLLAGKAFGLFSEGGEVTPPMSLKDAMNKAYGKKVNEISRIMVRDDLAQKKKDEYEKSLLYKIFGGGPSKDIAGRLAARKLAKEELMKENPELYNRAMAQYKHMGGPIMDDMYNRDNRMMRDRGTPPMNTTKMGPVQRGPFTRGPFTSTFPNRPTNTFPKRPSVDPDRPMRNKPGLTVDPAPDPVMPKRDLRFGGGK